MSDTERREPADVEAGFQRHRQNGSRRDALSDIELREAAEHEAGFDGPWWRHPPMRNALIAGVIAGMGFALAHLFGVLASLENVFYWVAIPIGAFHWAREGIEELVKSARSESRS